MPAFEYVALDDRGKQRKGVSEGDSPRQVRQQLREKGWSPLSIETTVQKEKKKQTAFFGRHSMSTADLALVTRQLGTLTQAGLPLEEALKGVAKQSDKARVSSIILAVRSKVLEGHSLASSLEDFPAAFPELYRATVAAGEHSGHLDLVLEQLSDYTESVNETRRKIKMAVTYPVILTVFAILIVIGMLYFVVPKITKVFETRDQALPFLTEALINTSDFLQTNWLWLILGIIAFILGVWRLLRNPDIRFRWHRTILGLPLAGRLSRGLNASRVANTLSILSRSGVPLVEAMRIGAQVASNLCVREAVSEAAVKVREGASLNTSLDQSRLFPPMMIQMIASGEVSGELETMLGRAAKNQERELEGLISTVVGLFEPLVLVIMGVVVLIIVLAIMLPVLSMNQLV